MFNEAESISKDPSFPKLTVVTPSYNQGEFLERTILSVLNQNYPNLEYIIIDGGSQDNSLEIIKKYEKYLDYWHSSPDRGQSDAINKGFQMSSGEILAWLNSDDTYLPGAFSRIVDLFINNRDVDMLYGRCNIIDRNNAIIGEAKVMPFNLNDYAYGFFMIPQQAAFWKRKLFFDVGMLNTSNYTCMDYELWLNMARKGAKIVFFNEYLANFRLYEESISGSGRYNDVYRQDLKRIRLEILGYEPSKLSLFFHKVLFHLKHPLTLGRYYLRAKKPKSS
jgi:glycosyltransferase involved in cell wall biosynthesis